MVQFKEHETGQRQTDPRIQKLDKLARLLKVHMHVDGVSYGLIPEVSPTNTKVTETVKKVFKVDTGELPVEEAKQFVEDSNPEATVVEDTVVEDTVDETTKEVGEPPVAKPTKTTTQKPAKTTTTKSTKSTKTT